SGKGAWGEPGAGGFPARHVGGGSVQQIRCHVGLSMRLLGRHTAPVTDLSWSGDGLLVSSTAGPSLPEGPVISVWNVDDRQLTHVIDESACRPGSELLGLVFPPN